MSREADTQQSLIVGLSYIIAKQAAQIEALEKRAACAEEELAKVNQPQSWDTRSAVLESPELLGIMASLLAPADIARSCMTCVSRWKISSEFFPDWKRLTEVQILTEVERLTRYLLVDIRGWHSLENFRAARLVRNRFGAGCVRLAFDLLAENGIVDIQNHPKRARNRALTTVVKRPWSRIESDTKGRSFLKVDSKSLEESEFFLARLHSYSYAEST